MWKLLFSFLFSAPGRDSAATKTLENGSASVVAACNTGDAQPPSAASSGLRLVRGLSWLAIGLVNLAVVVGVNFGFVYVAVYQAVTRPGTVQVFSLNSDTYSKTSPTISKKSKKTEK